MRKANVRILTRSEMNEFNGGSFFSIIKKVASTAKSFWGGLSNGEKLTAVGLAGSGATATAKGAAYVYERYGECQQGTQCWEEPDYGV